MRGLRVVMTLETLGATALWMKHPCWLSALCVCVCV